MKIDINIEDRWKYGEVAFLVDREDFLEDIAVARRLLGIRKLITHTQVEINKWFEEEINQALKAKLNKRGLDLKRKKKFSFPVTESQKTIDRLLKKYHKPLFYSDILKSAILCGLVTDEDFSLTSYVQIIDPMEYIERYKRGEFIGYPKIAIIISPETKPDEINELFRTGIQPEMDYFNHNYLNSKRNLPDTMSNIKKVREWYWMYQNERVNGKGAYKRIVDKWEKTHPPKDGDNLINQNTIEHAISRYKKNLKAAI